MDKLYMILLCLMIVPILICIKYSRKIKSDVASSIVKCLILQLLRSLAMVCLLFQEMKHFLI